MKLKLLMLGAAFGVAALVSGCETMSAEECAAADWRALGFNDAAQNGADNFGSRAESCGRKGFSADQTAYSAGFGQGMYQFCQPPHGFQFAMGGGAFNGSCPAELQRDFYAAYGDGQRVHQAQSELSDARNRLNSLEQHDRELADDIRRHQDAASRATTDEERNRLRGEINDLEKQRADARDQRRDLDPRIYYLQRRVDDLHREIGNRWAPW